MFAGIDFSAWNEVLSAWLTGPQPLTVDLPPGRTALGVLALGLPTRRPAPDPES